MLTLTDITAGDVMCTNLVTAEPTERLRDAALRMSDRETYCLLVPPREVGALPGVLTSKDIVQLLGHEPVAVLDELLVKDVMTTPAFCVQHDTRLSDCINLMRMAGVRRVPVLRGRAVIGVLSYTDIFERVARSLRDCAPAPMRRQTQLHQ